LDEQLNHSDEKLFVVADTEIFGRWNELSLVARRVDVPLPPGAHGPVEGKYARFPPRMENRLLLFLLDRTPAVQAAHVMDAVHHLPPGGGATTLATPMIESRVTIAASCSSPNVSV